MTVVLICGGRDFGKSDKDKRYAESVLTQLWEKRNPDMIIHGGAKGADTIAAEFALKKQTNAMCIPAKWNIHGKKAGPIRNAEMLQLANVDFIVAFPGGSGTKDMIKKGQKAGIPVYDLIDHYRDLA